MRNLVSMFVVCLAAASVASVAYAWAPVSTPEIDPAGILSGLTLLAGGLAVLRGRRRR